MENITLKQIIEATNGTLITPDISEDTVIRRVISDNRKAQAGDLFIAIVGEKMDGHAFVNSALKAGAVGAVVSKEPEEKVPGKFYVLVPDTLLAVGDLASYYRMQFHIPVIAVTGSVGKTTMKDMIASVLSQKYKVIATEGNYNNNIGVPRTLFRIDSTTEVAVVEMGMNHEGE
uniref:Mur ligase family protein n=1 Tax=Butyrivibrio sp. TaxID=28121 RepID=UPI0025DDC5D7